MCNSLCLRKNVDINFVLLEDLQNNCNCVYSRKQKNMNSLKVLQSTQLQLTYVMMRLEETTDELATLL